MAAVYIQIRYYFWSHEGACMARAGVKLAWVSELVLPSIIPICFLFLFP